MKTRSSLLLTMLVAATHVCFAQIDSTRQHDTFVFKPTPIYGPLYVLKSDDRTMELDPKKNEVFDPKSIDSKWVKMITVLNVAEAMQRYGERGANGVVVLQLVDNYIFSKAVYTKFKGRAEEE